MPLQNSVKLSKDAFGLRLVHGEVPGSLGRKGCVISHIFAGSLTASAGDLREGDEVVKINSINMAKKSDEEIQLILGIPDVTYALFRNVDNFPTFLHRNHSR